MWHADTPQVCAIQNDNMTQNWFVLNLSLKLNSEEEELAGVTASPRYNQYMALVRVKSFERTCPDVLGKWQSIFKRKPIWFFECRETTEKHNKREIIEGEKKRCDGTGGLENILRVRHLGILGHVKSVSDLSLLVTLLPTSIPLISQLKNSIKLILKFNHLNSQLTSIPLSNLSSLTPHNSSNSSSSSKSCFVLFYSSLLFVLCLLIHFLLFLSLSVLQSSFFNLTSLVNTHFYLLLFSKDFVVFFFFFPHFFSDLINSIQNQIISGHLSGSGLREKSLLINLEYNRHLTQSHSTSCILTEQLKSVLVHAENQPSPMSPSRTTRNILTTQQKGIIVGMMKAGETDSGVTQKLGLPQQTFSEVNWRYQDRGNVATASCSGGPCKLKEANLQQLNCELVSHCKDKLAQITKPTSTLRP
ncbi:hypothetical protein VP01_1096g1 [Puccinia sorghi]|uniref:Uncharacterized protein n=1 Tax=Puccinia sorghi TaxID=27349 RepID=A0A0L6VT04_9BASI|nr:hypothetical protein VP01_1096g1 [Puccinia sorghi]